MIENIAELSGGLIAKQKDVYALYIYRKKDFKLIQFINHKYVVETIFEVNKKLIISQKYKSDIGIEIWEKDRNNLYKLTGYLINNLLSSFCFIYEEKSNVFFCKDPLSKGLKDDEQVMQEKNKMDKEYSKIKYQVQKMIQEREELKNKIKLLNETIYQLGGGQEEIIKKSQNQFNPMMSHGMKPRFLQGQNIQQTFQQPQQYYLSQFGQMKHHYFLPNPLQGMGEQTPYQMNPTQQSFQHQYYHGPFNPTLFWMRPQFYRQHRPTDGQYNPFFEKCIEDQLILDGELSWKESTKFSTNILINYSKNKTQINLDKVYLYTKIYTINVNGNKLVSAFIYKKTLPYPTIISIKICDLKNHIGSIMVIESRRDLSFIDSIININESYILFGVWLINIDSYQIVFKFIFFGNIYDNYSHVLKKYFKLLNGNILIYYKDNNESGEYKFENNQLVKIGKNFIEDADIIIEKNDKEIITYSYNLTKLWEKAN